MHSATGFGCISARLQGRFPACWFPFLLCATQTEGSLRRRRRRSRRRSSHPVSQLTWSGGGCKNTVTSRRLRLRRSLVHAGAACTAAQRGVQQRR